MATAKHLMLDLETASTAKNAAILSIACIPFKFPECIAETENVFYRRIDPSVYDRFTTSFSMSIATTQWWMDQEEDVRNEAWRGKTPLNQALKEFLEWIDKNVETFTLRDGKEMKNIRVWAHGKDFDPPILENALNVCGHPVPWSFFQTRDTRTVYEIGGNVKPMPVKEYPKHHPVGDCLSQIQALAEVCNRKKKEWTTKKLKNRKNVHAKLFSTPKIGLDPKCVSHGPCLVLVYERAATNTFRVQPGFRGRKKFSVHVFFDFFDFFDFSRMFFFIL